MSTEKEMRDAFEKEYMYYEFPTQGLRDGALNTFSTGWFSAIANQSQLLARLERAENLLKKISEQRPETPDYWSECGQCSHNIDESQEILEQAK
jgi:hypothetical protein